jgi:hypothetical protein
LANLNEVVVLGAGFSNSVLGLPTLTELSSWLAENVDLAGGGAPIAGFAGDFELLLTYLAVRHPWKNDSDWYEGKALFYRIQRKLAEHIRQLEQVQASKGLPEWAKNLALALTQQRATVLTLNYDTVFERLVLALEGEQPGHYETPYSMYGLPLAPIQSRRGAALAPRLKDTVRLLKLHGSTNWYYSGQEGPPSDPIYMTAPTDGARTADDELTIDKTPLIIPPVSEKSLFYSNMTLRAVWGRAYEALKNAGAISFVGYSLPETDLTIRLLLRSAAKPCKVVLVDIAEGGALRQLRERYQPAFPQAAIDTSFTGLNAVERFSAAIR